MKTFSLLIGMILLGLSAAQAYEYSKFTGSPLTWASTSVRMRADSDDFPSGSSERDALSEAIDRWNDNPSRFSFNLTFESAVSIVNTENEIWGTDSDFWLDGAPAITYVTYDGADIILADILVDSDRTWETSSSKSSNLAYAGSHRSLQTVLLHELGHALGLQHETATYNIMGDDSTHIHANSSTVHFYAGEDACNGAVFLYGLDSSHREDVGVVHWKRTGDDGEYSSHGRTVVKDSSGSTLSKYTSNDEPVYYVTRGQVIQLQYTLENNGASSQSPLTGFYVSTNSNITTYDIELDTITPTLGRNTVFTTDQTLTIPSTLTRYQVYYLGVIVDIDDAISEVNENNNATYTAIYVR